MQRAAEDGDRAFAPFRPRFVLRHELHRQQPRSQVRGASRARHEAGGRRQHHEVAAHIRALHGCGEFVVAVCDVVFLRESIFFSFRFCLEQLLRDFDKLFFAKEVYFYRVCVLASVVVLELRIRI